MWRMATRLDTAGLEASDQYNNFIAFKITFLEVVINYKVRDSEDRRTHCPRYIKVKVEHYLFFMFSPPKIS